MNKTYTDSSKFTSNSAIVFRKYGKIVIGVVGVNFITTLTYTGLTYKICELTDYAPTADCYGYGRIRNAQNNYASFMIKIIRGNKGIYIFRSSNIGTISVGESFSGSVVFAV